MKSLTKQAVALVILALGVFGLSAFSHPRGGEGFEVYLNSKLVLEQFGNKMNDIQTLQIDASNMNDQLSIRYHHCGKAGKNRIVSIRTADGKTLKEWKFADESTVATKMSCQVKDIVSLQKTKGAVQLQLFYSSSELPKGRTIASISVSRDATASLR